MCGFLGKVLRTDERTKGRTAGWTELDVEECGHVLSALRSIAMFFYE